MYCTNCGKKINDNAKFCTYCGAKVTAQETPEIPGRYRYSNDIQKDMHVNDVPQKKPSSHKAGFIALAVVVVVAVLGIGIGIGRGTGSKELVSKPAQETTAAKGSTTVASTAATTEVAVATTQTTESPATTEAEFNREIHKSSDPAIQSAIDNFVSDGLRDFAISVNQKHKPGAAVWCQGGAGCVTYSSNEDVATVNDAGVVTGIAPGEAYIVFKTMGDMTDCFRYTVR